MAPNRKPTPRILAEDCVDSTTA